MAGPSWSWIFGGIEYSLDWGQISYFMGVDNLGVAPSHRLTDRGPLQHGSTDRGFRLDPRILILQLAVSGDTWEEYDAKRRQLAAIFKPSTVQGTVRRQLGSDIRQIDGYPIDGLSFNSSDRAGFNHRESIAIQCNDPSWYDPNPVGLTFTLAGGSGMDVPTPVDTDIGADRIDQVTDLFYAGDLPSFPSLIRIRGPITDPVIWNLTINEKLDLTGVSIPLNEYYEFVLYDKTDPYRKTLTDQNGVSKYPQLTVDSSLATWRIEADPIAPGGVNQIQVTGSATSTATAVDIIFYERFVSG